MSIVIKVASSLDVLSETITTALSKDRIGFFERQRIIVQIEGINTWLRYRIAEKKGIAANIEFVKMNDVVMMLYFRLCPQAPVLMERDAMTWSIFSIIDSSEFRQLFPEKAAYYQNNEVKRAALAAEMADLFDQYQIYRDDEIIKWNRGIKDQHETFAWQSWLWTAMKEKLGKDYADRPSLSENLIIAIRDENNHAIIKKYFPCIRFFGMAILTPYYLRLFYELSTVTAVEFYLMNPCPEILWMDDLSNQKIAALRNRPDLLEHRLQGNELLVNWGTVLRNTYQLLLKEDSFINAYETLQDIPELSDAASMLNIIQYEIKSNLPQDARIGFNSDQLKGDDSITINGCFTQVREVEVLYNYLIDQFAANTTMGSRDVLVMVSDIDLYAPIIKAVFENGPVAIPYTIADDSVAGANSLFSAIKDILSIRLETFTSEEVVSLLDNAYIRKRFAFRDLSAVRQIVRNAGIYWGTSSVIDDIELLDKTEAWMVSWEYGLQKIIYGLCMSGNLHYDASPHGLYPLDTAEGGDMAESIRLYHYVNTLKKQLLAAKEDRTLKEWTLYLTDLLEEMILDPSEEDDEDYPRFIQMLENISALQVLHEEKISFHTFRYVVLNKIADEKRNNRYGSRGVTFCSLLPMRSVPYDIIAMLGMDFNKFPRKDSLLSFSLLSREERPGDRSIRENDKHLFLETILAARKKLYISFLAKDNRNGDDLPPSILVDELVDYLARGFQMETEAFKKEFITLHPLHLFSKKYQQTGDISNNYLIHSLVKGSRYTEKGADEATTPDADFREINLDRFANFFRNPIKFFFNQYLDVYYQEEDERLQEHELFELDPLSKWQLRNDLLSNKWTDDVLLDRKKKQGAIPLSNIGYLAFQEEKYTVIAFNEYLQKHISSRTPDILQISIHLSGNHAISGSLHPVYENLFVSYCFSSSVLKHIMAPWVKYLTALAQPGCSDLDFCFLYLEKGNPVSLIIRGRDIDKKTVKSLIQVMAHQYIQGHQQMIMFHPMLADIFYTESDLDAEEIQQTFERRIDAVNRGYHDPVFSDVYMQKVKEQGLLNEANILSFHENTKILMQLLFDKAPQLLKKKKN